MSIEQVIDQKNNSFEYIVCPLSRPLQNHYFVAIATWLTPNVVLTARHVLNGFTCDDIKLLVGNKLYPLALLEDGADYDQDYAILYVEGIIGTPIQLTLQAPNEGSSFGCPRFTKFGEYATEIGEVPYSQHYTLLFESNLGVLPGQDHLNSNKINGKGSTKIKK